MNKKEIRKNKIEARNALSIAERERYSYKICHKILNSEIYKKANVIMIYRSIKGEVSLTVLENAALEDGKILAYPRCMEDDQMLALVPESVDAWEKSAYGILEPVISKSSIVPPEQLNLVICPCTAFDEHGARLGMGGGYYDRFLLKCTKAKIVAVAYECQREKCIPIEPWDRCMDGVVTEV